MTTLLFLVIAGLGFALFKVSRSLSQVRVFKPQFEAMRDERDRMISEVESTRKEIADLIQYRSIADANAYAQDIREKADLEAKEILSEAREKKKDIESKADILLEKAQRDAGEVVVRANEEAKKIAGDAYEALKKADALEKTAKAMKNIIEGYGDQYLVPTTSLLDHLAEEYSHTEAGNELKATRNKMRSMIKGNTAADCDYVEAHRRATAIEFVLDAFNGKVDTILTSVKEGNFGTLSQKIKDAFQTVNHNGTAFRDARITDIYLATRLEELKWACTVQALKERDREEQRQIREQMREEEKAAREIEKALKEAEKEEQSIAKAMEKVQKDLASANEQQRQKYEEKLAELNLRLKEAEEKNQRALSMAQQTKRGHVYVISNVGSFGESVVKIGMTRRLDPQDRVDELGDASVPFDFDIHAMILAEDAPALEKRLHEVFNLSRVNKVNPRKEFFSAPIASIRQEIEKAGIQAHWTMAADAREYRESLSIVQKPQPERKSA